MSGLQKHQGEATDYLLSNGNLQKELELDFEEVNMKTSYRKVPIGSLQGAATSLLGEYFIRTIKMGYIQRFFECLTLWSNP
jgi:hypothetical protein